MDYGNFVIHIFLKEYRDYYKLEDLWGDAQIRIFDGD
jgi:ribosome-associated protein